MTWQDAMRRGKLGQGCPSTPVVAWGVNPSLSLALGPDLRAMHCCREHAGQYFALLACWPPGHPAGSRGRRPLAMREPQEIEEREHEVAVLRVAAVDVAKAAGVVCTRVPREGGAGRFVTKVWPVDATTNAILELADYLAGLQVEKVVLESTSDYWRPFSTW